MNNTEFLNEVKESSLCPQNFEKIYEEFQVFQRATLDTLLEVHRVCEKNSVPYQLAYGSLLGFVRDNGQIPWDYDIDIFVPYEEKEKLIEALNNDLNENFYFYCPENNKKCRHTFMRITPNEYRTEALHVDVFFLVGSPENKEERARYAKRIKELSILRYEKLVNDFEESLGDIYKALKTFIRYKFSTMFKNLKSIEKEYNQLCSSYSTSESTYYISADLFAGSKDFPSEIMRETKLAQCDYGTVRIPVNYEKILEMLYGDYMSAPPLESRIKEVLSYHKRITFFQKNNI